MGLQTAQDVLDQCKKQADRDRVLHLMLAMVQRIESLLKNQLEHGSGDATNLTD